MSRDVQMGGRADRRDRARTEWPLVGRRDELDGLRAALVDQRRSVVLAGRAGVGKSRLGREAADLCEDAGFAVARVSATRASMGIPFGAFAPLLPFGETR